MSLVDLIRIRESNLEERDWRALQEGTVKSFNWQPRDECLDQKWILTRQESRGLIDRKLAP